MGRKKKKKKNLLRGRIKLSQRWVSIGALVNLPHPVNPPIHRRANRLRPRDLVSKNQFYKRCHVCCFGFVQGEKWMLLGKKTKTYSINIRHWQYMRWATSQMCLVNRVKQLLSGLIWTLPTSFQIKYTSSDGDILKIPCVFYCPPSRLVSVSTTEYRTT